MAGPDFAGADSGKDGEMVDEEGKFELSGNRGTRDLASSDGEITYLNNAGSQAPPKKAVR